MFEDTIGNLLKENQRLISKISELNIVIKELQTTKTIEDSIYGKLNTPNKITQWHSGPPITLNNTLTFSDYGGQIQDMAPYARNQIARVIGDQIVDQDLVTITTERDIRTRQFILSTEFYVYKPPR